MISIQNLSMHFTGEDLFTDISFLIREKDRIGLVGKNGAGKTTLLKLICGLEQPSKGDVIIPQGVTIGYLPQEKNVNSTKTVLDEALSAFDEYHQLERDSERLQQELTDRTDYESPQYEKLIVNLNNLNDRLALLGGNSIEGEAEVTNDETGETFLITPGTLYLLNGHERHTVRPKTDFRVLCVFTPPVTGREVHDENGSYPLLTEDATDTD